MGRASHAGLRAEEGPSPPGTHARAGWTCALLTGTPCLFRMSDWQIAVLRVQVHGRRSSQKRTKACHFKENDERCMRPMITYELLREANELLRENKNQGIGGMSPFSNTANVNSCHPQKQKFVGALHHF